jgi:Fe-S-cluster containining protein
MKTRKEELCLECQACFKVLYIPTLANQLTENGLAEFVKFYTFRGINLVPMFGTLCVVVDHTCPFLTKTGCMCYSTRPDSCRNYDGRTDPLLKNICKWSQLGDEDAASNETLCESESVDSNRSKNSSNSGGDV